MGTPPSGVPPHCWCSYGLRPGPCDPDVSVNGSGRCRTAWFAVWLAALCAVRWFVRGSLLGWLLRYCFAIRRWIFRPCSSAKQHAYMAIIDRFGVLWSACILMKRIVRSGVVNASARRSALVPIRFSEIAGIPQGTSWFCSSPSSPHLSSPLRVFYLLVEDHLSGNLAHPFDLHVNDIAILVPDQPIPSDAPVMITVPRLSVGPRDKCTIICLTDQIISSVLISCLTSPLTLVTERSF